MVTSLRHSNAIVCQRPTATARFYYKYQLHHGLHLWLGLIRGFSVRRPRVIKYIVTDEFFTAKNDYDNPKCF